MPRIVPKNDPILIKLSKVHYDVRKIWNNKLEKTLRIETLNLFKNNLHNLSKDDIDSPEKSLCVQFLQHAIAILEHPGQPLQSLKTELPDTHKSIEIPSICQNLRNLPRPHYASLEILQGMVVGLLLSRSYTKNDTIPGNNTAYYRIYTIGCLLGILGGYWVYRSAENYRLKCKREIKDLADTYKKAIAEMEQKERDLTQSHRPSPPDAHPYLSPAE